MNWAYARVSTGKQHIGTQLKACKDACERNGGKLDRVYIDENVSGLTPWEERQLAAIINNIKEGDHLYCTEVSRLGRELVLLLGIILQLLRKKIIIHFVYDKLEIDDSPEKKFIFCFRAMNAEIERSLISERVREGMLRARKKRNWKPGRNRGSRNRTVKLDEHADRITRMWNSRLYTMRQMARHFSVCVPTMRDYIVNRLRLDISWWKRGGANRGEEDISDIWLDDDGFHEKDTLSRDYYRRQWYRDDKYRE